MTPQLLQPPQPKPARVIHHLTWEQLEELDRSLSDFAGVTLLYLDGLVEIMPIRKEHEDFKVIIRRLLEVYMEMAGIRFYSEVVLPWEARNLRPEMNRMNPITWTPKSLTLTW